MTNARARSFLLALSLFTAGAVAACGGGGSGDIRKDSSSANGKGGGAGAGDGTVTPGSRIIPLSYQGSDGSKTFAMLFDKQLQVPCAFEPLGSTYVCIPREVYAISADVFYDSYSNSTPALYLDPQCGEKNAIGLTDLGSAQSSVIRILGTADKPMELAVVTPVKAGTKVYAWGQGGGQCCSCAEWVPPKYGDYRAYVVERNPDDALIAETKLVTATLDVPTAQ
jgi:hypothetical protein